MSAMSTAHSLQFYEFGGGSVFQVAATANGVTYNPATPIATPLATGTPTGTTAATSTPNGATLRFSFRDLIIPIVLSIGLLGGSLAALW